LRKHLSRDFSPTDLVVYIKEQTETTVIVITELIEITAKGQITATAKREFPLSVLQIFTGFDTTTLQPTVNEAALNQLLATFNLRLA